MMNFASLQRQRMACHLIMNEAMNHKRLENEELSAQLTRFWEIENFSQGQDPSSAGKGNFCEQHFTASTLREPNGRFVVSISFKENLNELGDSKGMALKRLHSMERKLAKIPVLRQEYIKFMREYEALGYMSKVRDQGDEDYFSFYLPHHAVIKADSTTTKLRVVFDGSAKSTSGLSLNEVQHLGPTVQDDLFSILLRFRQYKYVISADITKMYRQIFVKEEQRKFQKIL